MPPQGESTAYAIEDAVLLARVFERFGEEDLSKIFEVYHKTRRPRINKVYKEAVQRWDLLKDRSRLGQMMAEWVTWGFLSFLGDSIATGMSYDVQKETLVE